MYSESVTSSEMPPAWDDLKDRLDSAVAKLPAADRQVLSLRFYQHLTHDGVASALGISQEAARKRVTRALKRLRHALGIGASAPALGAALDKIPTVSAPTHVLQHIFAGTVSAKALLIAKGVSLMTLASKLKFALAVSVLTVTTGYVVVAYAQSTQPGDVRAGRAAADGVAASIPKEKGNSRAVGGARTASATGARTGASAPKQNGNARGSGQRTESGGRAIGTGMSFSTEGEQTIRRLWDGTHDITLTSDGTGTTATVKDAAGTVLFDGPYVTEADKAKVPAGCADKVARLEALAGIPTPPGGFGQGGGTGGMAGGVSVNAGPGNRNGGGGGGFGMLGPDYRSGSPGGGIGPLP